MQAGDLQDALQGERADLGQAAGLVLLQQQGGGKAEEDAQDEADGEEPDELAEDDEHRLEGHLGRHSQPLRMCTGCPQQLAPAVCRSSACRQ